MIPERVAPILQPDDIGKLPRACFGRSAASFGDEARGRKAVSVGANHTAADLEIRAPLLLLELGLRLAGR